MSLRYTMRTLLTLRAWRAHVQHMNSIFQAYHSEGKGTVGNN